MPLTKIEAIKKTIYNLENDVLFYYWGCSGHCNCGILVNSILPELKPHEIVSQKVAATSLGINYPDHGSFSKAAYCMTTDLKLSTIFSELKKVGFTYDDMVDLEYLGNIDVLKRIGKKWYINSYSGRSIINDLSYNQKHMVIKYLKGWLEILLEKGATQQQPVYADITKELTQNINIGDTADQPVKQLI